MVAASGLKLPHANVTSIQTFVFYQFYTFEDHYSDNKDGVNPRYGDTRRYTVTFDSKARSYFDNNKLEIIVFDDNAPILGVPLNQSNEAVLAENDDMIGRCEVPLTQLAEGCQYHDRLPIRSVSVKDANGQPAEVGVLEVKIDVLPFNSDGQPLGLDDVYDQVYSKQHEKDIIDQIARKLAPLKCETEMMFGLFSGGRPNCTKEDFKHGCLQRLKLARDGMTEQELDRLLKTNDYFRDSDIIEKHFWVTVF